MYSLKFVVQRLLIFVFAQNRSPGSAPPPCCAATVIPRRTGIAANTIGRSASMRIAPLYREMMRMRARKTVRATPPPPRHPGRPSPKPRLAATGAATRHLLDDLARVHRQRTSRLRDEHVLEGDVLRLDVLDARPVAG